MEAGVELAVESAAPTMPALELRLFGRLALQRDGAAVALPPSRKVRALLAYLALAPRPVPRGRLCELLWEVPDDPRAELRWCLTKLRRLLDQPGRARLVVGEAGIALDLEGCRVDALDLPDAARNLPTLGPEELHRLAKASGGELLEELDTTGSPIFACWLAAERRRFAALRAAVLERLALLTPGEAALPHLEAWLEAAPFERRAHALLLETLARHGRMAAGERHVTAWQRRCAAEGVDGAFLRSAWAAARKASIPIAVVRETAPADRAGSILAPRRASLAVMPFRDEAARADEPMGPAGALAHDIITRLARLRSLFVIAQGSVFALHERGTDPQAAGRLLQVDYVAGGSLRRAGGRLSVAVELAETRSGRLLWAERFDRPTQDTFRVLDEIGDRIVAAIADEIEANERSLALLRPPDSLDAWAAHHRGLWHMYRFNRADNERARHFFELALRLDPTFARAHAGLSFTCFQNAFQGWAERAPEVERAHAAASESLLADERDPAAHWAMGRALWLRGSHEEAVAELDQAVALSSNFAQAHYALAFVQSQSGDPEAAIRAADLARGLSPFDPLLFGMLGARAMALVRQGRFEEAAEWGLRAAARPNAHVHIRAIAAFSLALAGRTEEADAQLAAIREALPGYHIDDFLRAMQFCPEGAARFREAATRLQG